MVSRRAMLTVLGVAPVVGCMPRPTPEEIVFRLQPDPIRPPLPASLEVLAPVVAGSLAGSLGLLVVTEGTVTRVDEVPGGRWEDPPAEVLQRTLRAAALPEGMARPSTASPIWRLSWSLERMEAVRPDDVATPTEVRVALTWTLRARGDLEDRAGGPIRVSTPIPSDATLTALVLAFSEATTEALTRLLAAVSEATASQS